MLLRTWWPILSQKEHVLSLICLDPSGAPGVMRMNELLFWCWVYWLRKKSKSHICTELIKNSTYKSWIETISVFWTLKFCSITFPVLRRDTEFCLWYRKKGRGWTEIYSWFVEWQLKWFHNLIKLISTR